MPARCAAPAADEVVGAISLGRPGLVRCEDVVGSAWSAASAKTRGNAIPHETPISYHVTVMSNNLGLGHTVMIMEHNVMVYPTLMGMRLAGPIDPVGPTAATDLRGTAREWMGHRTCLPESLPVIGRAPRVNSACFAFGRGCVGICDLAGLKPDVAAVISQAAGAIDLNAFAPSRFPH